MHRVLALLLTALWGSHAWAATVGVVQLRGTLTSSGKPLSEGAVLTLEQAVTLSEGTAILRVDGGMVMMKAPATFVPDRDGMRLKSGSLLASLPALKHRWRVFTPEAVAAVRGTDFYVEARSNASTYICLCKGALEASDPDGSSSAFRWKTKTHAAYVFQRGPGGFRRSPGGMENHTDAELDTLHKLLKKR